MNLNELKIFRAVVEQRGFGRAARVVHLTQSAVSQAIQRLEDEVGVPLLLRGRPPSLTAAGRRVHEHAVDVLERDALIRRELEELRRGGEGVLSLGASQALSRELLPPLLAAFVAEWPGAVLHLETLPSRQLITVVHEGRLELGLGPFQRSMAGLEIHPLGTQRMVLYAGQKHLEMAASPRAAARALQRLPLVTSHLDPPGARPGKGQLREHFRAVWEVHSLDLRLALVRDGLAVGYLPRSSVAAAGLTGELVALEQLPFGVIERTVGLFHASRRELGALARALVALSLATAAPLLSAAPLSRATSRREGGRRPSRPRGRSS